MDWKKMMTYHALMYLACEQMVTGVGQLERKKWVTQPINKMCAWELNNSRWKIFVLEFDNFELFNSNSCLVGILQLNTKIFQGEMSNTELELSNSNAKMYFLRKFSKFDQQNIIVYLRMYFDMIELWKSAFRCETPYASSCPSRKPCNKSF